MSDLWRATTPDAINISDNFSQREFAAALQHLKPGKAPGPDSICSELILHAGAALKSWLRDFISSCLRRLKIPKIWRRALVVANDKPPQRGGAVPFPTMGRVEMACRFPEGLILGRFSFGQLFSFFIPAVQCAVTCGQHS